MTPTDTRQHASPAADVTATYRERVASFTAQATALAARSDRLSQIRMAVAAGGGLGLAAWIGWSQRLGLVVAAICGAAFLWLVRRHRIVRHELRRAQTFATLNSEAIARLGRKWNEFPCPAAPPEVPRPPLADDLDLFGPGSLFHLTSAAQTPQGNARLAQWFVEPAQPDVVRARQDAVAELAPQLDYRQELVCSVRASGAPLPAADAFLAWAEGEPWLAHRPWLRALGFLLPALLIGTIFANVLGYVPSTLWILVAIWNAGASLLVAPRIHGIYNRVSRGEGEMHRYAELLALVAQLRPESKVLEGVVAEAKADHRTASDQLRRLARLLTLADLRYSQTVYMLVQPLLMWDFHVLAALERWQQGPGRHVRRWLDALAQLEALASLASLHHDQPTWVFPEIREQGPRVFAAQGLGHPLLADAVRVSNDVEIGPPGTLLLVTGSNMSGKSTLLRSVGTNVALAEAGAPVCAASLTMPPLTVATSMRVRDSLSEGTSYFMAELKRLKQIVDAATAAGTTAQRPLLYLLDELLQGTNTRERQIAVRRVLEHLLACGSIGAITTHDLALGDAEPLASAARAVHFRETISVTPSGESQMSFDYQLREGPATTTNALALLELVGLSAPTKRAP